MLLREPGGPIIMTLWPPAGPEVDYGTFMRMIEEKNIGEVEVEIVLLLVELIARVNHARLILSLARQQGYDICQ